MCITRLLYKKLKFDKIEIRLKNVHFKVDVADSALKQMLGLMYRENIKDAGGMLFIFRKSRKYGIWMHNMRFPIDILWLDDKHRIVDIVEKANPCVSLINCRTHYPDKNSKFVIELKSGMVKKLHVRIGDIAEF